MTKIDKLIKEISKEYLIKCSFIKDEIEEEYINNCFVIGKSEIIIGKYENEENKLISFFHEIGHCLIEKEFIEKWKYNTLIIEIECWNIGIEEARKRNILFSDNAIKFGYEKALSYVGHDEREVYNYNETCKINLIMEN